MKSGPQARDRWRRIVARPGCPVTAGAGGAGLRRLRLDARSVDDASRRAWSELAGRAAEPNPFAANPRRSGVRTALIASFFRWTVTLKIMT
jgi:hypothetical protein